MKEQASKIIYGNIYTVDKNQPKAAALAVKDGKFVYVGDEAGAKDYIGDGTEEIRYDAGLILPGLGEGHGHIAPGGTEALFFVHMNPMGTLQEHLAAVKEFIEKHPELDVIQGAGFVPTPDMGPNGPTADLLDGMTDKPIVLADIGHHSYWVNHAAMERLGIDLSWKSSQIEGNTYSLLETERLLRESKTADGKTKEEAVMLLNHKDALRFILDNPDYLQLLTVSHIEDIHQLLTKELSVDRGIRHRRVGITGTNYHPLDNEFQIREAMRDSCNLINSRESIFEKALLTLVLLSYIQAFSDGNKRTARITSNAILIANGYCPLSFRSVDSIDYKKAMLIFYEQNNLYAFKQIFIDQFEFAVREYF